VIRAVVLALLLAGCASTIHVESAACDLDGEINTGTVIECDDGAVRVELLRALVL
jgi:outer membrane murein-binding lipoprotein Lpp